MNAFGNLYKRGTGFDGLDKVQGFFFRKGHSVTHYDFCVGRSGNTRTSKSLARADLPTCVICGRPLTVSLVKGGEKLVRQKKHLVFHTCDGQELKTCYGVGKCVRERGCQTLEKAELIFEKFYLSDELQGQDELTLLSIREDFYKNICSFIEKWRDKDVSKDTLGPFLSDSQKMSIHLEYFDNIFRDAIMKRVYSYVGVVL